MDRSFDDLSSQERDVIGEPADYDWDHPITPPRAEPKGRTQFSMRIEAALYTQLADLAASRGLTFSELVRETLSAAVKGGVASPGQGLSIGDSARIVTTVTRSTVWTAGPEVLRRTETKT